MVIDKEESRRIAKEIRRALLDVWDPIGIRNEPNAQDEYDSYLGRVFRILTTGATDVQIADWLLRQADENMCLAGVTKEAMYLTVYALRKIKVPRGSA